MKSLSPKKSIRPAVLSVAAGVLSAGFASAAPMPLPGLFNTGVDDAGVSLTDNAVDTHYTFTAAPDGAFVGQNPLAATSAGGFPIGPWLGDSPTSAFITPTANTVAAGGDWTYSTTFNVPAGTDPRTAFIHGRSTSDNALLDIRINGVSIRPPTAANIGGGNFVAFDANWTITGGFVAGANTIDFVVNEASAPDPAGFTSLRAEMTGGIATTGRVQIPGLINTGETSVDGALTADNGIVTGWTGTAPDSSPFTPLAADSTGGFPINGPWLGDNTNSTWIVPSDNTNGAEGDYRYNLSFDLTGMDPASAEIIGRLAVDNDARILLNGVDTGVAASGFGAFTAFSLISGFQSGVNTLTVIGTNALGSGVGPTGIRVEFDSASVMPVPEPTVSLLGGLFAGAALLKRRRQA